MPGELSITAQIKTCVVCDLHLPNGNYPFIRDWVDYLAHEDFDKVILNGDIIDCFELSSFDRSPDGGEGLDQEIRNVVKFLETVRKYHKKEIIYILGNHSFRLRKYIITQAPELYNLKDLRLEKLLELERLNIQFVDIQKGASKFVDNYVEEQGYLVGHFNIVRSASGATAKALVEKYGKSIIQSHTHRLGMYFKRTFNEQLIGIEGGCMCDLNPSYGKNVNWQNGFVTLEDGKATLMY